MSKFTIKLTNLVRTKKRTKSICDLASEEPNRVCKGLYIGNRVAASNEKLLKQRKITHILNCSYLLEDAHYPKDFQYLILQLEDVGTQDLLTFFPSCFEFIERARKNGRVLVHCFKGVSRCAAVVCGYLMFKLRISFGEALDVVSTARPTVLPNRGFIKQLQIFEKLLLGQPNKMTVAEFSKLISTAVYNNLLSLEGAAPSGGCIVGDVSTGSADMITSTTSDLVTETDTDLFSEYSDPEDESVDDGIHNAMAKIAIT